MDKIILMTFIGIAIAIIGFVYVFLRNFMSDVNAHMNKVDDRIDDLRHEIHEIDDLRHEMDHIRREMKEENRKKDIALIQANVRMDGVYNLLLKRSENLKG
jgi:cell division protein FtsL